MISRFGIHKFIDLDGRPRDDGAEFEIWRQPDDAIYWATTDGEMGAGPYRSSNEAYINALAWGLS